jgi:hypothetical protein
MPSAGETIPQLQHFVCGAVSALMLHVSNYRGRNISALALASPTAMQHLEPSDNPAVLADHDAIGIGVHLDRTPDRAGGQWAE